MPVLKDPADLPHIRLSAAPSAADGAAAAAAHFRAGGDQRGGSTRCQHGRHGGPSRQEEEDHPDCAEKVHHHHILLQINGEEIQHYLLLHNLIGCPPEHSQDVLVWQSCCDRGSVDQRRRWQLENDEDFQRVWSTFPQVDYFTYGLYFDETTD